jgi:hypothetical protein
MRFGRLFSIGFMVLGLSLSAAGCAGDDDDGSAGMGSGGSAGATGGSGGSTGGSGGTGDTGGMGGSGGSTGGSGGSTGGSGGMGMTPTPIMCGSNSCTVGAVPAMFGISACCTEEMACGANTGECLPTGQEGTNTTDCPSATSLQMFPLAGCCKPDGRCGLDYSGVEIGCVAREEVTQAMVMGWPLNAMPCGDDNDAGM